ncbi:MAG: PAS domain S-box protein, partial [Solirubrobacterales bacterium]
MKLKVCSQGVDVAYVSGKVQSGDGSMAQANPLRSDGPGGAMIRRVLPATVAVLVILAALRWLGQQVGLYGTTTGLILMTVASVGIVAGLLWYFARWLDRNDAARRAAEEDLKASARYFDLSSDMLCTAGFDGVFRKLNATWTETLGWSEEELSSRPFVEFVHPDDRERTERESAGLAQGEVT